MSTRNNKKTFVQAALGALFGALLPAAGWAACVQTDLQGTWYVMAVAGNVQNGTYDATYRCKLVVSSTGVISANSTGCKARTSNSAGTGATTVTAALTGGSLTVNSSCAISGKWTYNNGAPGTDTIQFAQMAKDKNTFTFTTYEQSGAEFGEAVKQ